MNLLKANLNEMMRYLTSGNLISSEEFVHPTRTIDSYVILYGIKNTLHIKEDEKKYEVDKNTSLILYPFTEQASLRPSKDLSYYWCHFYLPSKAEIIGYEEAIQLYQLMHEDALAEQDNIVLIPKYFKPPQPEKLILLFRQLLDYSHSNYYTKNLPNFSLASILIELTQQAMKLYISNISKDRNTNYRFSEIVGWIKANANKTLTVPEIAKIFNYNPNYLSNLFKEKTGYPLVSYINRTKIQWSTEILLKTDKTVKEIAYSLGFSDYKYFLKLFKSHMDMTPTQYRNAYHCTHINAR